MTFRLKVFDLEFPEGRYCKDPDWEPSFGQQLSFEDDFSEEGYPIKRILEQPTLEFADKSTASVYLACSEFFDVDKYDYEIVEV